MRLASGDGLYLNRYTRFIHCSAIQADVGRMKVHPCVPLVVAGILLSACGDAVPETFLPATPPTASDAQTRWFQVPWVLYGVTDDELDIGVMLAGCQEFAHVDIVESDDVVELLAWAEQSIVDRTCSMVLTYYRVRVVLDSALDSRELKGCLIEESAPHSSRVDCAERVPP